MNIYVVHDLNLGPGLGLEILKSYIRYFYPYRHNRDCSNR